MSKKLPKERLEREILNFLNNRKVLVLCTCNNNIPRATPLDFYNDGYTLFMTTMGGAKVENLKNNPIASIGIYTPLSEGKVQGLQITSTKISFIRQEDAEYEHARKIVKRKAEMYLKIEPEKIELLDYSFIKEGYSRFQVLELSEDYKKIVRF